MTLKRSIKVAAMLAPLVALASIGGVGQAWASIIAASASGTLSTGFSILPGIASESFAIDTANPNAGTLDLTSPYANYSGAAMTTVSVITTSFTSVTFSARTAYIPSPFGGTDFYAVSLEFDFPGTFPVASIPSSLNLAHFDSGLFEHFGPTYSDDLFSHIIPISVSVQTVPLPASLPLLAAALLGLGAAGVAIRRKQSPDIV